MSKDTETQAHVTNSYTSITRSTGPSKTACAKCDAKNLPICICKQSHSEENKSKEKSSTPAEETKNIHSMQQASHFSTPSFKSGEELNKDVSSDEDTQGNTFTDTIQNPEHFVESSTQLHDKDLIENVISEENCQSFNSSPFTMTLKPY